jgi:5-formyltetrahydrofolate cyclo-ligase
MIFNAKGYEPSMTEFREYLIKAGKNVFLPVVGDAEMFAVKITENTEYKKNIYGIDEPSNETKLYTEPSNTETKLDAQSPYTDIKQTSNTETKLYKELSNTEKTFDTQPSDTEINQTLNTETKRGIEPPNLDVIIVPLAAFDADKNRLGRGKGYYDKFLSKTSAIKIGAAYKAAEVAKINSEKHDVKMDMIITEK